MHNHLHVLCMMSQNRLKSPSISTLIGGNNEQCRSLIGMQSLKGHSKVNCAHPSLVQYVLYIVTVAELTYYRKIPIDRFWSQLWLCE